MSIKNVEKFFDLIKSDENIAKELIKINNKIQQKDSVFDEEQFIKSKVVPIAKKHGINFTAKEFLEYAENQISELSDEELLNISGGASRQSVAWGFLLATLGSFLNVAAINSYPLVTPIVMESDQEEKNNSHKKSASNLQENNADSKEETSNKKHNKQKNIKKSTTNTNRLGKEKSKNTSKETDRVNTFALQNRGSANFVEDEIRNEKEDKTANATNESIGQNLAVQPQDLDGQQPDQPVQPQDLDDQPTNRDEEQLNQGDDANSQNQDEGTKNQDQDGDPNPQNQDETTNPDEEQPNQDVQQQDQDEATNPSSQENNDVPSLQASEQLKQGDEVNSQDQAEQLTNQDEEQQIQPEEQPNQADQPQNLDDQPTNPDEGPTNLAEEQPNQDVQPQGLPDQPTNQDEQPQSQSEQPQIQADQPQNLDDQPTNQDDLPTNLAEEQPNQDDQPTNRDEQSTNPDEGPTNQAEQIIDNYNNSSPRWRNILKYVALAAGTLGAAGYFASTGELPLFAQTGIALLSAALGGAGSQNNSDINKSSQNINFANTTNAHSALSLIYSNQPNQFSKDALTPIQKLGYDSFDGNTTITPYLRVAGEDLPFYNGETLLPQDLIFYPGEWHNPSQDDLDSSQLENLDLTGETFQTNTSNTSSTEVNFPNSGTSSADVSNDNEDITTFSPDEDKSTNKEASSWSPLAIVGTIAGGVASLAAGLYNLLRPANQQTDPSIKNIQYGGYFASFDPEYNIFLDASGEIHMDKLSEEDQQILKEILISYFLKTQDKNNHARNLQAVIISSDGSPQNINAAIKNAAQNSQPFPPLSKARIKVPIIELQRNKDRKVESATMNVYVDNYVCTMSWNASQPNNVTFSKPDGCPDISTQNLEAAKQLLLKNTRDNNTNNVSYTKEIRQFIEYLSSQDVNNDLDPDKQRQLKNYSKSVNIGKGLFKVKGVSLNKMRINKKRVDVFQLFQKFVKAKCPFEFQSREKFDNESFDDYNCVMNEAAIQSVLFGGSPNNTALVNRIKAIRQSNEFNGYKPWLRKEIDGFLLKVQAITQAPNLATASTSADLNATGNVTPPDLTFTSDNDDDSSSKNQVGNSQIQVTPEAPVQTPAEPQPVTPENQQQPQVPAEQQPQVPAEQQNVNQENQQQNQTPAEPQPVTPENQQQNQTPAEQQPENNAQPDQTPAEQPAETPAEQPAETPAEPQPVTPENQQQANEVEQPNEAPAEQPQENTELPADNNAQTAENNAQTAENNAQPADNNEQTAKEETYNEPPVEEQAENQENQQQPGEEAQNETPAEPQPENNAQPADQNVNPENQQQPQVPAAEDDNQLFKKSQIPRSKSLNNLYENRTQNENNLAGIENDEPAGAKDNNYNLSEDNQDKNQQQNETKAQAEAVQPQENTEQPADNDAQTGDSKYDFSDDQGLQTTTNFSDDNGVLANNKDENDNLNEDNQNEKQQPAVNQEKQQSAQIPNNNDQQLNTLEKKIQQDTIDAQKRAAKKKRHKQNRKKRGNGSGRNRRRYTTDHSASSNEKPQNTSITPDENQVENSQIQVTPEAPVELQQNNTELPVETPAKLHPGNIELAAENNAQTAETPAEQQNGTEQQNEEEQNKINKNNNQAPENHSQISRSSDVDIPDLGSGSIVRLESETSSDISDQARITREVARKFLSGVQPQENTEQTADNNAQTGDNNAQTGDNEYDFSDDQGLPPKSDSNPQDLQTTTNFSDDNDVLADDEGENEDNQNENQQQNETEQQNNQNVTEEETKNGSNNVEQSKDDGTNEEAQNETNSGKEPQSENEEFDISYNEEYEEDIEGKDNLGSFSPTDIHDYFGELTPAMEAYKDNELFKKLKNNMMLTTGAHTDDEILENNRNNKNNKQIKRSTSLNNLSYYKSQTNKQKNKDLADDEDEGKNDDLNEGNQNEINKNNNQAPENHSQISSSSNVDIPDLGSGSIVRLESETSSDISDQVKITKEVARRFLPGVQPQENTKQTADNNAQTGDSEYDFSDDQGFQTTTNFLDDNGVLADNKDENDNLNEDNRNEKQQQNETEQPAEEGQNEVQQPQEEAQPETEQPAVTQENQQHAQTTTFLTPNRQQPNVQHVTPLLERTNNAQQQNAQMPQPENEHPPDQANNLTNIPDNQQTRPPAPNTTLPQIQIPPNTNLNRIPDPIKMATANTPTKNKPGLLGSIKNFFSPGKNNNETPNQGTPQNGQTPAQVTTQNNQTPNQGTPQNGQTPAQVTTQNNQAPNQGTQQNNNNLHLSPWDNPDGDDETNEEFGSPTTPKEENPASKKSESNSPYNKRGETYSGFDAFD